MTTTASLAPAASQKYTAAQQAAAVAAAKANVAGLLKAGNYAGAWQAAANAPSYNRSGYLMAPGATVADEGNSLNGSATLLSDLSNPAMISQMTGGAPMTAAQQSAFYKSAIPYANQIAKTGISSTVDANGNPIYTGANSYTAASSAGQAGAQVAQKLTSMAANPTPTGAVPNIGNIGGKTADSGFAKAIDVGVPLAIAATAGLVTGGAAGAAIGPGLGGAIASGAAGGIGSSAVSNGIAGKPVTLGSLGKAGLIGGVTGGAGYAAQPITGALTNAGLPAPVAAGVVKGGIGAGVGALGSALQGGNVANGALTGGLSGVASGLVGNATGNSAAGQGAGIIAGNLAGKYLTSPSAPVTPTLPAAAPPAATVTKAPATATAAQGMSSLPVASNGTLPPVAAPAQSTAGLGYAPRTQTNYSNIDFANYGAGPEAQFFTSNGNANPYQAPANVGAYSGYTAPVANYTGPSTAQVPSNPAPMMNTSQGTITRANSA
jgi:hypothetical protein